MSLDQTYWIPDSYRKGSGQTQTCAAVINTYGAPIEFVMKKRDPILARRRVFRMTSRDAAKLAADLIDVVFMSGHALEPDHPLAKRLRPGGPPSGPVINPEQ